MIGNKQIKQLFKIASLFWILTGCATGGFDSETLDYSLQDIQKVLSESMPAEVGYVSPNGREFFTKQFKLNMERAKAVPIIVKSVILGDRRPYKISVEANVVRGKTSEEPQAAFASGEPYFGEESLSKRVVTKVQSELAKRRKNKNLFDDFRAF